MSNSVLDEEIVKFLANNDVSMREASLKLGIPFSTFRRRAKILGIYTPKNNLKKYYNSDNQEIRRLEIILHIITNNKDLNIGSFKIKTKLIKQGILKDECFICKFNEKRNDNDEFSVCELHHIDGNSSNNRLTNLVILCPNHHALTKNFRRNSISNYKEMLIEYSKYQVYNEEDEIKILDKIRDKIFNFY